MTETRLGDKRTPGTRQSATLAIVGVLLSLIQQCVFTLPARAQAYSESANAATEIQAARYSFESAAENSRLKYESEYNAIKVQYLANLSRMSSYWSSAGRHDLVRMINAEIDRVAQATPYGSNLSGTYASTVPSPGNPFGSSIPANGVVVSGVNPALQQDCVEVFQHENFRGTTHLLIAPGNYGPRELGIGNDKLSSLIVPRGYEVTLYEHSGFQGRSAKFEVGRHHSVGEFNDLTSSVKIEKIRRKRKGDHDKSKRSRSGDDRKRD